MCEKGDLFDVIRKYKKPSFAQQVPFQCQATFFTFTHHPQMFRSVTCMTLPWGFPISIKEGNKGENHCFVTCSSHAHLLVNIQAIHHP